MQRTEQGGRGLRPRPPCGVNDIRIYGHGVGFPWFGLGGQISLKVRELGPVRNLVNLLGHTSEQRQLQKFKKNITAYFSCNFLFASSC